MKKAITLFVMLLLFAGCRGFTQEDKDNIKGTPWLVTPYPRVEGIDFEGHRYLFIYSSEGCGIIHAESCQCKTEKPLIR